MRGLQAIVTDGTGGGQADVHCGGPTLEAMVMVMMEEVGRSHRYTGRAGLDGGEARMVVDGFVGQENFLAAAAAHIQGGKIIEGA